MAVTSNFGLFGFSKLTFVFDSAAQTSQKFMHEVTHDPEYVCIPG